MISMLTAPARLLRKTLEIVDEFPTLIDGDDGRFMSKVALVINPPRPKPPRPPKVTKVEDNTDPAGPESETGTE